VFLREAGCQVRIRINSLINQSSKQTQINWSWGMEAGTCVLGEAGCQVHIRINLLINQRYKQTQINWSWRMEGLVFLRGRQAVRYVSESTHWLINAPSKHKSTGPEEWRQGLLFWGRQAVRYILESICWLINATSEPKSTGPEEWREGLVFLSEAGCQVQYVSESTHC
jgi:hypothetical protein